MKDFKIDANNNLVATSFQLGFTALAIDYVIQKLQIKLRTFLGEYFLDTTIGVPYFEDFLIKNPDLDLIGSLLKKQIYSITEVKQITKFLLQYNNVARQLVVTFAVSLTSGESGGSTLNILLL